MCQPSLPPWPLLAALLLVGCSSDMSLTDRLAGGRVRGDANGVVVYQAASVVDALPLAIGHCSHFHRSAQYERRAHGGYRFRCVSG